MFWRKLCVIPALLCALVATQATKAHALSADTLESVVSVLPVWPGRPQGGTGGPRGRTPEGSGVVLRPGLIVTAWHVVEPAERIDVRLSDGRILPARLLARDGASDIALLRVDAELVPIRIAPEPRIAQPVCAIGNAFGLGLSVTCGVVSAVGVTDAGFNPIEDFVQFDAAANPGVSGGALVDADGRLVGMVSAIFASGSDTNIGVNFAVSTALLSRVVEALADDGDVHYRAPGWRLAMAGRDQLAELAAPVVRSVREGGPAAVAGIEPGDLVLAIGPRRVRTPRDAATALAVVPDSSAAVDVTLQRKGQRRIVALAFDGRVVAPKAPKATEPDVSDEFSADCPHPVAVCGLRQAVFPLSSFDPIGSATRIGPNLIVTNRHVVGDRMDAIVHTPDGPQQARVIPSAYRGDLVLLKVAGLPDGGLIANLDGGSSDTGVYYAIGADVARKTVRVFEPGGLIAGPAEGADLGRIHVRARMQPGVSGGALADERGTFVGIAVGGGDGRFEAIPLAGVRALLALRAEAGAEALTRRLGAAFASCAQTIKQVTAGSRDAGDLEALADVCSTGSNAGQLLEAGRVLARAGDIDGAIALHGQAAEQVPNSISARMSLLVSLQLAARFADMTDHARRLMRLAPDDPQALRFAIQSGVWGNAPDLAEEGYRALLKADPRQAQAARRFIDNAPPAPVRR